MHVDKYRCTVLTTSLRTAPLHKPPPLPSPLQPPPPPRHRQRPPQTLQNKTKPRTCIVYTRLRLLFFTGLRVLFFFGQLPTLLTIATGSCGISSVTAGFVQKGQRSLGGWSWSRAPEKVRVQGVVICQNNAWFIRYSFMLANIIYVYMYVLLYRTNVRG